MPLVACVDELFPTPPVQPPPAAPKLSDPVAGVWGACEPPPPPPPLTTEEPVILEASPVPPQPLALPLELALPAPPAAPAPPPPAPTFGQLA